MFKISIQLSCDWFKSFQSETHKNTMTNQNFVNLATKTIHDLEAVRTKSTIDNYRTALRAFCRYAGADVSMNEISPHLIEGFQQWLREHQVTQNTISCYMRSLRSLLHQMSPAMKQQLLFEHVFTGKTHTEKRSIPTDDIERLRRLPLRSLSPMAFSRDLFLFSFYALGMPFVDMAFLQKRQMSEGYITYHRHKTGQRIRVKIEPPMQAIIDRYSCQQSLFVFPILDTQDDKPLMTAFETARTRYNRHLKRIGKLAGLSRHLTSYVARHSWASLAYHANIDLSIISKALGHTSPKTTLTYIREIDDNRIDQANSLLLGKFSEKVPKLK